MKQYYILFKNHDNGMRLYNSLKSKNIKATIAPTPRVASKSCGISLLINKDDIEKIREIVASEASEASTREIESVIQKIREMLT